jgi:hypothetical protein
MSTKKREYGSVRNVNDQDNQINFQDSQVMYVGEIAALEHPLDTSLLVFMKKGIYKIEESGRISYKEHLFSPWKIYRDSCSFFPIVPIGKSDSGKDSSLDGSTQGMQEHLGEKFIHYVKMIQEWLLS